MSFDRAFPGLCDEPLKTDPILCASTHQREEGGMDNERQVARGTSEARGQVRRPSVVGHR